MFNASMAREISSRAYSQDEFDWRIQHTHEEIERAAMRGYRYHLLWYTDHSETALDMAVKVQLRNEGFYFDVFSEVLGGVRQHSGVYVCW